MPKIARVRTPDGRVARFRVPDDATPEQITAAAKKHFAQQRPKPKERGGFLGALENVVSSGNELLLGAVEGAYNAASAVTDPISRAAMNLVSEGSGDRAVAEANRMRRGAVNAAEQTFIPRPNPVARTAGRVGAAIAVPLPKVGLVGKIGNRAIQGAVGGAAVREVDESAAAPAAIGAAANVVLPPVLSRVAQTRPAQAVGRAASRVAAPVIGALDNAAEAVLPGVNRVLGRQHTPLRGPPPISPAPLSGLGRQAQARADRFRSLGIERPTTGMVTRDPAAFSFEQNTAKLQGVGDDLARQMREVETGLVERGRQLVRDMGGAKGSEATGKAVEEALDAKRTEMQHVTSRLYDKVREARGDESIGNLDTLRRTFDESEFADNPVFEDMTAAISKRLGRYADRDGGAVGITLRQAEELRKFIGKLGNGTDPTARAARGELIGALDDDVVNAVGDDAFKAARASARARFEEFSKTFPGRLADEKLAPELLAKRVLGDGVRLSDLRALRRSLMTGTQDQIARGRAAWRGLQAQALDDLLGKSIDEDGMLRGSILSREFGKAAPKLRELLGPEDFKTLRRLAAATRDVKAFPVGHSVNTSNTAITLQNMFAGAPARVREGWLKMLGKFGLRAGAHAGAAAAGGPVANVAVEGIRSAASSVAARRAEQQAAQVLMDKIRLAQSPEAAAAAIREAQAAAASNPVVAGLLEQMGLGQAIGGTAAATAQ